MAEQERHPSKTPAQDYWPDNPKGHEWTDPEVLQRLRPDLFHDRREEGRRNEPT
jgi:hypothetical protein